MREARNWAMYVLHLSRDLGLKLVLDTTDVDENVRTQLSEDIPQTDGGVQLAPWRGVCKESSIEFVTGDGDSKTLHIRSFTTSWRASSLYVSLYDTTGARFAPLCLVIWNRAKPHVNNQGCALGRCPDSIITLL